MPNNYRARVLHFHWELIGLWLSAMERRVRKVQEVLTDMTNKCVLAHYDKHPFIQTMAIAVNWILSTHLFLSENTLESKLRGIHSNDIT